MKVLLVAWNGTPYGVELVADNKADREVLQRFWLDGAKVNVLTGPGDALQITFRGSTESIAEEMNRLKEEKREEGREERP